ncbi:MAG: TlyA family rRNA (cytidine-2'-O)-methyltransferase [Ponticaulis sp.]|nr:TlyA family rRNA (cytidine-2'-O)-methyltransferase [Ponticaulis sp.]
MRLDKYLTETGIFPSRSVAQEAIAAGKVSVNGKTVTRASEKVSGEDTIEAERLHTYVSRAALKLKGAFEIFDLKAEGKPCLDVGCSTGGFTEVLLEAGAAHVTSVDVGRDQFHVSLRQHASVTLLEQTDARNLTRENLKQPPEIIVCDASFIGLEKVLQPALDLAAEEADLIALFKPQFQVGRKNIGKGGIVTDQESVDTAKTAFIDWLEAQGWAVKDWAPSPITGSDGNQEWLCWARRKPV